MNSEFWFLISAFAVFRLAELIAKDDIFNSLHIWIGKRAAAGRIWKFFADLLNCPLCIGVWLSFPAAFLFVYSIYGFGKPVFILTGWLGMAGMQYLLSSLFLEKS